MGEKFPRILPKVATFTSLLGSFTCRKFTTWDRRLYFPSEGRRAEDIFARKIRRLRPGLNPRTRVPETIGISYFNIRMSQLERGEDWVQPALNIYTHLSPHSYSNLFNCPSSTEQPKTYS